MASRLKGRVHSIALTIAALSIGESIRLSEGVTATRGEFGDNVAFKHDPLKRRRTRSRAMVRRNNRNRAARKSASK